MATVMTYAAAVENTIIAEMKRDPTIYYFSTWLPSQAIVDAVGWDRAMYSGIEETQAIGSAVGSAVAGMRPIYDTWVDFYLEGWGQLVLQAAKLRFKLGYTRDVPAVFKMAVGFQWGGSVHHSSCCHNWMANAPGLLVVYASTPADAVGLWRTALRQAKDPVVICEPDYIAGYSIQGPVPEADYTIPFGQGEVKLQGTDVTIAAVGAYWVSVALAAAADLAKQGISAEVWDPRTLTPFDRASLIVSVQKTGAMVVVDQAPKSFGTTGEFFATVGEALTPIPPMARVASMDVPVGFSKPLEEYLLPSKDKIISAVKGVLSRKSGTAAVAPPPGK